MSNVNKRPEKDCPTCGDHFVCVRPEQKYCSKKCIQGKGRAHNICPCGVNTGSYQRKYCCSEHREQWGGRKAPVEIVTHVCVGCGEEFQRPWFYPGKKKYCSNACAHRQVKKVRDKYIADLPEGAVVFHSGYEVRFWAACLRFDVPVRSYDGPDIETSLGIYRPDFIITTPGGGEHVIDVKGFLRPESEQKITEAIQQGVMVWVVDRENLPDLEKGDWAAFLTLL